MTQQNLFYSISVLISLQNGHSNIHKFIHNEGIAIIASYAARHASSFLLVNSEGTAGVESGSIKDDQMKSSNHPNDRHPANEGRLNGPGAWCGNPSQNKLYLQIDFEWNFEGTYLHALERFQLLPLLDTDVTGKISYNTDQNIGGTFSHLVIFLAYCY